MSSLAELLEALKGDYGVRMKTDSLKGEGILAGDLLIVQQANTAPEGALVVTQSGVTRTADGARVLGRVIGMARGLR